MIGRGCDLKDATKRKTDTMTTTIHIKHKHAGHMVAIKGHSFTANDAGQWNLAAIWKTLRLPKTKGPGKWAELKEAKRLTAFGKVETVNGEKGGTWASKQATIRYAAWVSTEFEDMVFDAFEAILEIPEVITIVAAKMFELGRIESARRLAHYENKSARNAALRQMNRSRCLSPEQTERKRLERQASAYRDKLRKAGNPDWNC
jgi:hypothetical protein